MFYLNASFRNGQAMCTRQRMQSVSLLEMRTENMGAAVTDIFKRIHALQVHGHSMRSTVFLLESLPFHVNIPYKIHTIKATLYYL